MPAQLAGRQVQVLRLTRTPAGEVALLAARSGRSADLLAAWTSDGTHWTISAPLILGTGTVRAAGFSAAGAAWVLTASGQADTIAAKTARWRPLPRLPAATAALAFGPAGGIDALAARGSRLTDWRLTGSSAWTKVQTLDVPVQYGSSS